MNIEISMGRTLMVTVLSISAIIVGTLLILPERYYNSFLISAVLFCFIVILYEATFLLILKYLEKRG